VSIHETSAEWRMTAEAAIRTFAVMDVVTAHAPFAPPAPFEPAAALRAPRRWPARVLAAALLAAAIALDRASPLLVVVLFVLVVPFERLFPRHRQPVRRPELRTDIAYAIATPVFTAISTAVGLAVGLASLFWLPGLLLRPLVSMLPGAALFVVGVALFDLTVYWLHRFSHEVPFLWRFHAVHHSTKHLDWISGVRNHPLDGALLAPPFVLLVAAGFPVGFTGVLTVIQVVTGLFLHANVRWRWRPLQRIVITPEFHHWHHSSEPAAINTNYSVFLPVWDIIFGTYRVPRDSRPTRYGIAEPMPTGLANQLRYPLRDLPTLRDMIRFALRHPVRGTRHLARSVRRGVGQMWSSARRPTRRFLHSTR
jgi:sterol desaturase/sphingolipid hydroxylase (fatty acid hydroxylase superfamily)